MITYQDRKGQRYKKSKRYVYFPDTDTVKKKESFHWITLWEQGTAEFAYDPKLKKIRPMLIAEIYSIKDIERDSDSSYYDMTNMTAKKFARLLQQWSKYVPPGEKWRFELITTSGGSISGTAKNKIKFKRTK